LKFWIRSKTQHKLALVVAVWFGVCVIGLHSSQSINSSFSLSLHELLGDVDDLLAHQPHTRHAEEASKPRMKGPGLGNSDGTEKGHEHGNGRGYGHGHQGPPSSLLLPIVHKVVRGLVQHANADRVRVQADDGNEEKLTSLKDTMRSFLDNLRLGIDHSDQQHQVRQDRSHFLSFQHSN
jgi:hypothetical protein